MLTKVKGLYMRDRVVKKLFTNYEDGKKYLSLIISNVIDIPVEVINVQLRFIHPQVSVNENYLNCEADLIVDLDDLTVNIEVNGFSNELIENKNIGYVCHLKLKGNVESLKKHKKVIQINLNAYDITKKDILVTKTEMYNHDLQQTLHSFVTIYDVNLEKVAKMSYTDIRKEKNGTLTKLLYLLVNSNEEELNEAYKGDVFMNEMVNHARELTENFDLLLYYDSDELMKNAIKDEAHKLGMQLGKEQGMEIGLEQGLEQGMEKGLEKGLEQGQLESRMEIAKNLFNTDMSIEKISEVTGLTINEVKKLKENM